MGSDVRHGVEINAQTFGQGERPALVLHCMLGSARMWEPVLAPLGDRISATAFDWPNHGKSGPWVPDAGIGYQTLATRIAASFIDRPIDLIGHSFGAVVALRLAAAAPEAIRTLTLVEPVLFSAAPQTTAGLAQQERQRQFDAFFDAGDHESAARMFIDEWGAGVPWDDLDAKYRDRFVAMMPIVSGVLHDNHADPAKILREGALEGIDAPVMIVYGTQSPALVPEVCEAIAARLPDVGVASVPDAGHMVPLSHPKQLSDLIGLNLDRA